ncbi:MAG: DUF2111 domain-containing protein [Candidatus Methanomethylophilaceae archaeon]|nr:DUF2111 domain-containing protein [Candidatus Methanomethylophilaceae archaeon]MBO4568443.1 DUF2111 domain-containing protein [Candidatus Methanomethylophilaceae archaeon]
MILGPSKQGGPLPKFNDYHLWKALDCLDGKNPIGRKRLAELLGIGEGSTRTIISMMQDNGLITIGKSGILLTSKGMEFKKNSHMEVVHGIHTGNMTIGEKDVVVRVPKMARSIKFGCEERDAAIRSGATGATTLVFIGGKLSFPGSDYPVDEDTETAIRSKLNLKNDDVVIIGTGPTEGSAEMGAVIAGLNIIGGLKFNRELEDILSSRSSGNELISLAFAIHDLVGGLPVCAKSRDNLGIRIENGKVIDNAYTGQVLEEVISAGTTIRKIAVSGPYKGIRVIVTPIELDSRIIAAIGVVDIRSMAGIDNLIRLRSDDNERGMQSDGRLGGVQDAHLDNRQGGHGDGERHHKKRLPQRPEAVLGAETHMRLHRGGGQRLRQRRVQAGRQQHTPCGLPRAGRHNQSRGGRRGTGPEARLQHTLRRAGRGCGSPTMECCIHFFTSNDIKRL